MDEKVPETSVESEHTQVRHESLAPGKLANFPGSLVANHLGDNLKTTYYPQSKGRLANWVLYFREGWDDPAIWRSAVSIWPGRHIDPAITWPQVRRSVRLLPSLLSKRHD